MSDVIQRRVDKLVKEASLALHDEVLEALWIDKDKQATDSGHCACGAPVPDDPGVTTCPVCGASIPRV